MEAGLPVGLAPRSSGARKSIVASGLSLNVFSIVCKQCRSESLSASMLSRFPPEICGSPHGHRALLNMGGPFVVLCRARDQVEVSGTATRAWIGGVSEISSSTTSWCVQSMSKICIHGISIVVKAARTSERVSRLPTQAVASVRRPGAAPVTRGSDATGVAGAAPAHPFRQSGRGWRSPQRLQTWALGQLSPSVHMSLLYLIHVFHFPLL
jgi:hypothetical protein